MRLGLTTAAFYGRLETEEAAAHLRALDVDCAEVFLQTPSEYSASFGETVKAALAGIPATSVHPLGTAFETSLFSPSRRQRADAERLWEGVLCAAEAFGARRYVYHGRSSARGRRMEATFEQDAPRIEELCAAASAHGVRLCWENVSWCQLTSPERVRAVRRACPHAGFVLDVKQAMQSGFDAVEFAREMGDRLCNVHVCDFDASGRLCLPGRGIYDFAALAMALRAAGYDGPVILEPYANLFREEAELADSLAYLRKTMEIASQKTANRV